MDFENLNCFEAEKILLTYLEFLPKLWLHVQFKFSLILIFICINDI